VSAIVDPPGDPVAGMALIAGLHGGDDAWFASPAVRGVPRQIGSIGQGGPLIQVNVGRPMMRMRC